MPKHDRLYFDYAATTPLDPRVFRAMRPYIERTFGNPGSLHEEGQEALAAIDRAREGVADLIGSAFRDVVFTGSATEANNLALFGTVRAARAYAPQGASIGVVVSAIEHESVLEPARALEREGLVHLTALPVDAQGLVRPADLAAALTPETAVVSIMYGNNEIGTVQPIAELSRIVAEFRSVHRTPLQTIGGYPRFHTDASQAGAYLSCDVRELGVDLLTLSGHKLYGPKGVGMLYVRDYGQHPHRIQPMLWGGGQEHLLRSGTENVSGIVGFHAALAFATRERISTVAQLRSRATLLVEELKKRVDRVVVNSIDETTRRRRISVRLPHIVNVSFPGISAAELIVAADRKGLALSAGSACTARGTQPSHVLSAIGLSNDRITSSIRLSVGRETSISDVRAAVKCIVESIKALQR